MPSLENIVINFGNEEADIHLDFRLYLTSMPADYFPISVL
jgi:Dynein heavy chain region D6 P-loop domain